MSSIFLMNDIMTKQQERDTLAQKISFKLNIKHKEVYTKSIQCVIAELYKGLLEKKEIYF